MKIIGHKIQIDMLNSAIEKNRVHSAYLFVGQSGIGKKQVSLKFAQMLNCQNPQDFKKPCGECLSCKKIEKSTHPDVMTITVQEEKTSIAIEQIREMIKGLQFRSVMGGYNVRIIDDAHLMRTEAANSLLKILEEPPVNTVIVLITPVPKSLPSTIISRCAVVYFGILSDDEIKNEIKKYDLPSDEAELVISMAAGSLGYAIELTENRENIPDYKNIISDFECGKFSNKKFKERKEAVDLLNMLAARVRVAKPEKLGIVLKMKNYITRNTNRGLTLEVLKNNLKQ